jgi:peptidyl-prolyl cis-trans isomerase C
MKKPYSLVASAVGALALASCSGLGNRSADVPPVSAANAAAMVNGQPVSKASLQVLIAEVGRRSKGEQPPPKDKVLDELIAHELLKQEAERQGLTKDPANAARVENAERLALSQLAIENYLKNLTIGDAELKQVYDERIKDMKQLELRARHILLENREEAVEAIASLKKGAKFEDLARKLSKDPGSRERGGDLGWFSPKQMVPEFAELVVGLKNGEIAKEPLKTQFGWHVVRREEAREQTAPPFEEVKEQIRAMVKGDKLQQRIEELKKTAKIERKD